MVGFRDIFGNGKSVIGMIHLAGMYNEERVEQALKEIRIYEEEGLQGAIIEDYHGNILDIESTLLSLSRNFDNPYFQLGVNTLIDPYHAFELADRFGASFVQFDSVQENDLDLKRYLNLREEFPNVAVMGGVRFKYTQEGKNPLEEDLKDAMLRCEAICTTGDGTGIETPIEKLEEFGLIMGDFPLVTGAGVDDQNVQEQLRIADAAIVGSYFKREDNEKKVNTEGKVKRYRVRTLMDKVRAEKH